MVNRRHSGIGSPYRLLVTVNRWHWIAQVTTNAAGYFTATFVDPVTATWSAEYLGDQAHLAAVGAMIGVPLKG